VYKRQYWSRPPM